MYIYYIPVFYVYITILYFMYISTYYISVFYVYKYILHFCILCICMYIYYISVFYVFYLPNNFITTDVTQVILTRNKRAPWWWRTDVETCCSVLYVQSWNKIIYIINYRCAFVGWVTYRFLELRCNHYECQPCFEMSALCGKWVIGGKRCLHLKGRSVKGDKCSDKL